jgi:hypothetical protein
MTFDIYTATNEPILNSRDSPLCLRPHVFISKICLAYDSDMKFLNSEI